MAKTLKQLLEVNQPKPKDEKKFKDKHVTVKTADANGNGDDVFQATNIKTVDRESEGHGYGPGDDEKLYEEMEVLDEASAARLRQRAQEVRNQNPAKAALLMKAATAAEQGDATSASNFIKQAADLKEEAEQVDEMSKAQIAKREDIVKGMKKNLSSFKQRYGEDAKSVMYATATKQAMKEEVEILAEGSDAEKRYGEYHKAASDLLTKIGGHMQTINKSKGTNTHWGHVGDIRSIHDQLRDIHDRLAQTGEYAKQDAEQRKKSEAYSKMMRESFEVFYDSLNEENQQMFAEMVQAGDLDALREIMKLAGE